MSELEENTEAILLISKQCPHCASVMQAVTDLLKSGDLTTVKISNIDQQPELAREYGVRSVPFFQLRDIRLTGLHSAAELNEWISTVTANDYYVELLALLFQKGELERAAELVLVDAAFFDALFRIAADTESDINIRIGVSAIIEGLEGKEALNERLADLLKLAEHGSATVRGDAAHFLGLTHSEGARKVLKRLAEDDDASVREVATDSLEDL